MLYRALYTDDEMEVFRAETDYDAFEEAWGREGDHGLMFGLVELDEGYDPIRVLQ